MRGMMEAMEKNYSFAELVDIIRHLRSGNGCPWDREQTHESLKPCLTEECEEVVLPEQRSVYSCLFKILLVG